MPFFQHGDVNLFYTDEGVGVPVLLLHGWTCDSHDWSFQIPHLLSLGLRVIALDQRGHGRSSAPNSTESYSMRTFADDALALLEYLGTGPVILVGHSMGGVIASVIAAENPEAVRALVVVHPIYGSAPPALRVLGEDMRTSLDRMPELVVDMFQRFMYTSRTPAWLRTWTLRRVVGTHPAALAGCVYRLVETYGRVMGHTEESKAFLRKRQVPRLAVCVTEAARDWEEELGVREGVDEVHLVDEGVFSHMVESERVNGILGDWLRARGLLGDQK